MSFSPSSPVTGAPVTGFTSPTYTLTADAARTNNAKQYAVTAIGGTQTGVDAHSVSKPFTITFVRPSELRALPPVNPVTGQLPASIPTNKYQIVIRKGVQVNATNVRPLTVRVEVAVPAGADIADAEDVKAAISAAIGVLNQQSSGIAQTLIDGIM